MKKLFSIILFAILAAIAASLLYYKESRAPSAPAFLEEARVFSPQANEKISSPYVVKGEADGNWYFEASFPVKVTDQDGTVLGEGPAMAIGKWMTTNPAPFEAAISFSTPHSPNGTVVLAKDNPAGLPQNESFIVIPVKFAATSSDSQTVKIFFGSKFAEAGSECDVTYPAWRIVPKTQTPARAALEELLKGPTPDEKNLGYVTNINSGTNIQKLALTGGVAKVDFNEILEKAAGGSCRATASRWQITNTLKQLPGVKDVVISVNGAAEGVPQP